MAEAALKPPSKTLLMMEMRAIPELFGFTMSWPTLATFSPRGDGQPVLVLPGLITSDNATRPLRGLLTTLGYPTYGWEMGRNYGPLPGVEEGLVNRVKELSEKYGRKVSIVGWSLGGIYARQLGKMLPDHVRQVISLGSPFNGDPGATRVYPVARRLMPLHEEPITNLRTLAGQPLAVPNSNVYSRQDAIVPWQIATETTDEQTENIEVFAGHMSLGFSPTVLFALADRLGQAEDSWQPFSRDGWRIGMYGQADISTAATQQAAH